MPKIADWDERIGRRLRLRDLRVFFAVLESGSLAKAAELLHVSQPAVSQVISDLEHALGVKLFDRSTRGVEPTLYARALLVRGRAAFDELRQGIRDIEFLANPEAGELTIGYPESTAATVLPKIIEQFSRQHPHVIIRGDIVAAPAFKFSGLRDRTHDLVITPIPTPVPDDGSVADLNIEVLLDDPWVIVAGIQSRWARRRKVDLAELINEPWLLTPAYSASCRHLAEAFRARGLCMPKATMVTFSTDLRAKLSAGGDFITLVPSSILRGGNASRTLKMLPVNFPGRTWLVAVLTLRNRTLSPVAGRFIECARQVAQSIQNNK
jgi:DNA-binding transcriptional LysR family regulator